MGKLTHTYWVYSRLRTKEANNSSANDIRTYRYTRNTYSRNIRNCFVGFESRWLIWFQIMQPCISLLACKNIISLSLAVDIFSVFSWRLSWDSHPSRRCILTAASEQVLYASYIWIYDSAWINCTAGQLSAALEVRLHRRAGSGR